MSRRWIVLAACVAAAVCVRLAMWQWARREQVLVEIRALDRAASEPVLMVDSLPPEQVPAARRRVRLAGRWDDTLQVLLSGRTATAGAGVVLVGAFRLRSGDAVLVERAWLEAADGRTARLDGVPMADTLVSGEVALLPQSESPAWTPLEGGPGHLRVWSARQLTASTVREHVARAEARWYVLAGLDSAHASPEWRAAVHAAQGLRAQPSPREQMHLSYALQWLGIAAVVLGGGLALAFRRRG